MLPLILACVVLALSVALTLIFAIMRAKAAHERRVSPRVPVQLDLSQMLSLRNRGQVACLAADVSAHGLRVFTNTVVAVGERADLAIGDLRIPLKVVRSRAAQRNFEVAMEPLDRDVDLVQRFFEAGWLATQSAA